MGPRHPEILKWPATEQGPLRLRGGSLFHVGLRGSKMGPRGCVFTARLVVTGGPLEVSPLGGLAAEALLLCAGSYGAQRFCLGVDLNFAVHASIFFLCCRLASSELNIKTILQEKQPGPADCFLPKWMW